MGQVIGMQSVVIEPNGRAYVAEIDGDVGETLRAMLGGYVEHVGLSLPHAHGFVNEDGYTLGLAPNRKATAILDPLVGGRIVGRMVVLGAPNLEGDPTPVPAHVVQTLVPEHRAGQTARDLPADLVLIFPAVER